ncbi:N,N'-diacetyllegionaminic acid synthase [Paenibacillus allorhizoplanae]|uniref:N,N'-diacetyllegionaminic acid synthase n=1 Tax=Paenibacillus allorhizoplanae TaxID=2905648 RepID=A0ABM9CJ07_9BACL|nr:N-acetylneuraminate synthase [Paenibacillus allorhizoplanae]CAH1215796.1 N,N'-diacetyllegionaminic acid synthase [Paenibacillus allorhizoplanae]
MKKCYIIAEAGVNHNGSMEMAKQLIDEASNAGADAVKFQTFNAKNLVTQNAPKAQYQKNSTDQDESQFEMLKKLELTLENHLELLEHCKKRGIQFLSTPFDISSVELLTEKLKLTTLKLPSGEITNAPLLLKAAESGANLIVSTGMSTLAEVEAALGVLAFGYLKADDLIPSLLAFQQAFASDEGKRILKQKVILLHCTTEYPAPFNEVNLLAMDTLRESFGLNVGFSDHTEGIAVPIAAAARNAVVIEKHFTLDRGLSGPDHKASLEPGELKMMIASIRQIEVSLGTREKSPTSSEEGNRVVARRSIVAARRITQGELFTEENLAIKRPGGGVSPMMLWDLIGKRSDKDYLSDEMVDI